MLWNDEHISKSMLEAHLNPEIDAASRNKDFMERSIHWIISHFHVNQSTSIIDFGCGPGLYTIALAETGASVTGVDLSQRSIRYAQGAAAAKGLRINYLLQDYLEFKTHQKFDLILMIWCDFSVLSPEKTRTLLATFRNLLTENGRILLDVDSLALFHNTAEQNLEFVHYPSGGFMSAEPHFLFRRIFKYADEHLILRKETVLEDDQQRDFYIWNQCYSLSALTHLFAENGLEILSAYSDVTGTPFQKASQQFAVTARKAK